MPHHLCNPPGRSIWTFMTLCLLSPAHAQQCIDPPAQTAPYIRAAVTATLASVTKLGSGSGFGIAIEGGMRDVYRQYPNADKLVVMQALLAQSCEVIKGLSLSAPEKLSAYKDTQSRVLRLFNDSDASLKPENLRFLHSDRCYGLPVRATWQTTTDLAERSLINPPAGSPEAAAGMALAVRAYPVKKELVSALLKEPLSAPSNTPSPSQLSRYLKETFETWETDSCCRNSKWIGSSEVTVVATDQLTSLNPKYEPRTGVAMTYQRDSKVIQALAYFAPRTAPDSDRLGGVWAECRVDAPAAAAYETYCKTLLSQFRFTHSPPRCGIQFERSWQRGDFLPTIPPPPKN
jgi:hypothetical protein